MSSSSLTEGAIAAICSGGDVEMKPLLQVADVRQVNTQNPTSGERFRLLLSDGRHLQQGMLATQRNDLVKSGRLKKGSIVQLLQFVCNTIQNRMIIIIIDLEVIQVECPAIGEPTQYPLPGGPKPPAQVSSSVGQASTIPGNVQYGNPHSYGSSPVPKPGAAGGPLQQSRMEHRADMQSYAGPTAASTNSGRYAGTNAPSMYAKSEFGTGSSGIANGGGSFGGLQNPKIEVSRAPANPYVNPPQFGHQQPPPMYVNRGPIAKNEAPPRIIPIAALNPYQGRWTIKARVTAKGELRHYNNPRGDGKVFSFDLLDSDGGEIRVTCFNAVADQFYNLIEVGKVYLISKGSLKPAQKNFNHLRNDHEIFLETTSVVLPCVEDDDRIPRQQFHFRPIRDVEGMDPNTVVDVIGVVSSISPSSSIMRKNGTETQKRTIQLKDMSGKSVELTLWGNFCNAEGQTLQNMCDSGAFPVLAVKSGRVSEFNGKAVGTLSTSQLVIEPDFPEARRLREWFDREGKNIPSVSISREMTGLIRTDVRKTVSQIKDEKLGTSEKPDWITVCATITFIKVDNFCYTACPILIGDRQCNKKVINNGDGKWRCDRCDQSFDECDYRYILQFQIQDHTGLTWVTAFQECGEEIMGMPAKSLYYLKYEEHDDEKFSELVRGVLFHKYILKLKVKEETFSDEQRIKSTAVKAERTTFTTESRVLLDMMDKLKAGDSGAISIKSENVTPNAGMANPRMGSSGIGFGHPAGATASTVNYGVNASVPGRDIGLPTNQIGSYGNQYMSGYAAANASAMPISCTSCGGVGHTSSNCPSIINGLGHSTGNYYNNQSTSGAGASGGSGECYKCHQFGHWARDCPGLNVVLTAHGGSNVATGRYGGIQRQHVGGF